MKDEPDHSPDLGPHSVCRCRDPFCAGLDKPRRPPDYVVNSPSGTFRRSAYSEIGRQADRRHRKRLLDRVRRTTGEEETWRSA